METKVTNLKETQELIASIRFIAENIQPKVLQSYKYVINNMKRDVFDSLLSTMIPLVPKKGSLIWPESGEVTRFTYDYERSPSHVASSWMLHCRINGIDHFDLVFAILVKPDQISEVERERIEFLIYQAKQVL